MQAKIPTAVSSQKVLALLKKASLPIITADYKYSSYRTGFTVRAAELRFEEQGYAKVAEVDHHLSNSVKDRANRLAEHKAAIAQFWQLMESAGFEVLFCLNHYSYDIYVVPKGWKYVYRVEQTLDFEHMQKYFDVEITNRLLAEKESRIVKLRTRRAELVAELDKLDDEIAAIAAEEVTK